MCPEYCVRFLLKLPNNSHMHLYLTKESLGRFGKCIAIIAQQQGWVGVALKCGNKSWHFIKQCLSDALGQQFSICDWWTGIYSTFMIQLWQVGRQLLMYVYRIVVPKSYFKFCLLIVSIREE